MTTKPTELPTPIKSPIIRQSDSAPFVCFDIAPAFGTYTGAIQIELASRVLTPIDNDVVNTEFVVTGHIRCSPAAAASLRDALDKAIEMLKQPQGSDAEARSRMN